MTRPTVPPRPAPARRVLVIYGAIVGAVVLFGAVMNLRLGRPRRSAQALSTARPMSGLPGALAPAGVGRVGELLATVPHPRGADDVLVSLTKDGHSVALFDGGSHTMRWSAGSFAQEPRREYVVVDTTRAFVIDGSRITAFSLKDGVGLWQSSLLTELSLACAGCLRVLKDRVVVLQKDSTVQAFDAASGRVVWSVRVERYPMRLFTAADDLILEHITVGRNSRAEIDVVDPEDGSTIRTMRPSCINAAFHQPERPYEGSPLLFDREGKTMYTIFGNFSHCAQAWNVATGQRRWNTYLPSWNSNGVAVVGSRALLIQDDDHGITALDVATGKPHTLIGDHEHVFKPLYGQGDEVIVAAAPTWQYSKVALWGLDAATGKQRWQFPLSAEHLMLQQTFMDSWSWRRTEAGLVVLQQLPDDQVSIDVIDPLTGVSRGRKLFSRAGSYRSLLRDDLAWVQTGDGFDAIKLPDGALAYHVP